MGVPQGLANNLEDLQRALEVLTEATAQEREDNAAARAQNEALQAALNALQVQMESVGPGGPAINAMQMQPPLQAHIQPQHQGRYYNNNRSLVTEFRTLVMRCCLYQSFHHMMEVF